MTLKALPIGIQAFSTIRESNFVYVDKTDMVHQLANTQGRFFLSRPRRFGKSMLISTFQALFEGKKELFDGLSIYDHWDWDKTYPVIRIDFAAGSIENRTALEHRIKMIFRENQNRLGIECSFDSDTASCFEELIRKSKEKTGQKVVILIDEYDKPILDQIENIPLAASIREGLKNIYSVMKGMDEYIQFIFMTGVTKFSKVSLFSGINQIVDITLDQRYATICGYTQQDLETTFAQHLAGVDWQMLKDWYNGYNFLGSAVYNPFDILLFIDKGQSYRSYWFETGSPSFLLKLFKQQRYFLPELEAIEVGEDILDSFDVENINPITLLFQTGYLTIEKAEFRRGRFAFKLVVPNTEVRMALNDHFINAYSMRPAHEKLKIQDVIYDSLIEGNLLLLEKQIKALFAGIPWRNFTNNDIDQFEGYYASVLYAFFASINAIVIPEDISNQGQADLTVILGNAIYVMEIKRDTSECYDVTQANPALAQIIDCNYAQKYLVQKEQGKAVTQLGLVFNTNARNLVAFDALTC